MKTALSGGRAWLVQRATAVYLLTFIVFVLVRVAVHTPSSYAEWRAWTVAGGMRPALLLFWGALLLHAWVGLRDVILDYVKPLAPRITILGMLAGGLLGMGAWVLQILLAA